MIVSLYHALCVHLPYDFFLIHDISADRIIINEYICISSQVVCYDLNQLSQQSLGCVV